MKFLRFFATAIRHRAETDDGRDEVAVFIRILGTEVEEIAAFEGEDGWHRAADLRRVVACAVTGIENVEPVHFDERDEP